MTPTLFALAIVGCFLPCLVFVLSLFLGWGRKNDRTVLELKRAAFGSTQERIRRTQPGMRLQHRPVLRWRKRA